MRKTILTALVTLLVMLAVVSCDNLIKEQDGFVTLSINTDGIADNSRSLADGFAKQEATYVEVIFKYVTTNASPPPPTTTTYYRAEGYLGPKLKVKIPTGYYKLSDTTNNSNGNDAIILVGRKSDGTLLATGVLSSVTTNGMPDTNLQIVPETTAVVFTLTSLTANLKAGKAPTEPPSFSITDSTVGAFSGKTMAAQKYDGNPCFQVPPGVTSIEATLKIDGLSATGANIKVNGTETTFATFAKVNLLTPNITASNTTSDYSPQNGNALGSTGAIVIKFNTPATGDFTTAGFTDTPIEAKYIITFAVPVVGYDATIPGSLTWLIRGGTKPGPDFVGGIKLIEDSGTSGTYIPDPAFIPGPAEGVALIVTSSPTDCIEVDVETGP